MGDSLWLWDAPHMRGFKPLCIAGLTPSMVMRRSCSVSCGVLGRLQAMARAGGLQARAGERQGVYTKQAATS